MVYNKCIVILFILYSEVVSSDSSNGTGQKYTLHQYNDSMFYVQAMDNQSETNQDKSLKEWIFSSSTINSILENVLKSNHSVSPKKREAGIEDFPLRRKNRRAEDEHFTVHNETMAKNFNVRDLLNLGRQANTSPDDVVRESILSVLQNNSAKALLERGDITLKPMPLLTKSNTSIAHSQSEFHVVSNPDNTTPLSIDAIEGRLSTVDNFKTLTSDKATSLDGNESRLSNVDFKALTSDNTTPFDIDGIESRLSSADIKTLTSKATEETNGTFSAENFENVSKVVTYPFSSFTSSEGSSYTPYETITDLNFYPSNLSTHFISSDSLASTVSTDFKHTTHTFRAKSTTEREFDNLTTTSMTTTYKSLLNVDDNETKSTSTAFAATFKSHQSVSPKLFTKDNEKKVTKPAELISTDNVFDGRSTSYTNGIDIALNRNSQSHNKFTKRKNSITEEPTSTAPSKVSSYYSSKSSSTDDKNLHYKSSSEISSSSFSVTTTPKSSISSSSSPEISMGKVKIFPVGKKDNSVLLAGIIMCCFASILLVIFLVYFCYQKRKKAISNQIEMVHMKFDQV